MRCSNCRGSSDSDSSGNSCDNGDGDGRRTRGFLARQCGECISAGRALKERQQ